jgi:hypothetical protein
VSKCQERGGKAGGDPSRPHCVSGGRLSPSGVLSATCAYEATFPRCSVESHRSGNGGYPAIPFFARELAPTLGDESRGSKHDQPADLSLSFLAFSPVQQQSLSTPQALPSSLFAQPQAGASFGFSSPAMTNAGTARDAANKTTANKEVRFMGTKQGRKLVRREGIEPSSQAWEARILPMNYRRK